MAESLSFEELFIQPKEYSSKTELKILLISDIRSRFLNLIKLKELLNQKQMFFDAVFVLGNFLDGEGNYREEVKAESVIASYLNIIESINTHVFFIPSSTDPQSLFRTKPESLPSLSVLSENIHNNFFKLAEDLFLIGFGRSSSEEKEEKMDGGEKDNVNNLKCTTNNRLLGQHSTTKNFPNLKAETKHSKELASLFRRYKDFLNRNYIKKDIIKFILLSDIDLGDSNDGDQNLIQKSDKNNCDSVFLRDLLVNDNTSCFLTIHSSNSSPASVTTVNEIKVINPGNCSEGKFTSLTIARENCEWKIKECKTIEI